MNNKTMLRIRVEMPKGVQRVCCCAWLTLNAEFLYNSNDYSSKQSNRAY